MHIFNVGFDVWVVKISSTGVIEWQRCYGGSENDYGYSVSLTPDGGYIFGAQTRSSDGDVTGNPFNSDRAWLIKTNSTGVIQWQSGITIAYMNNVEPTADGGYIAACLSAGIVPGAEVTCGMGGYDILLVKFSSTGAIVWQKCLGGTEDDFAQSIHQTADGGYIVAGGTSSSDGDATGYHVTPPGASYQYYDYWVVKLNSTGNIMWQKTLGGSGNEFANDIQQTTDGGFIVAGQTVSTDGDVTGFHTPLPNSIFYSADYWIVKLDSLGNLMWQKALGGSGDDEAKSIRQTADGGYIVAGYTNSTDGDVTGYHINFPPSGMIPADFWIVKLDSSGNMKWQKCLGGGGEDIAKSIQQISDGSYIIAGYSHSNDGDVSGHHGATLTSSDLWVVKIDSLSNLQWQKSLGR